MGLANKVAQHSLGNFKFRDHAIAQRADGDDICRGTPDHFFCLGANRQRAARPFINGDPGGFIDDYTLAAHIYQGVGCTQINPNIKG